MNSWKYHDDNLNRGIIEDVEPRYIYAIADPILMITFDDGYSYIPVLFSHYPQFLRLGMLGPKIHRRADEDNNSELQKIRVIRSYVYCFAERMSKYRMGGKR